MAKIKKCLILFLSIALILYSNIRGVYALQISNYFQYYSPAERDIKVRGMDVSRWQGLVDYEKAKAKGLQFVIMKSSMGTSSRDIRFTADTVSRARKAGFKVGTYHYAKPSESGMDTNGAVKEAENFYNALISVYGSGKFGDILPFLDFEDPSAKFSNDSAFDWIEAFSDKFYSLSGIRVGIYTAFYYVDSFAPNGKELIHSAKGPISNKVPVLWLAYYAYDAYTKYNFSYPDYNSRLFGGYKKWTVWQYQSDTPDISIGSNYGVESVDLDLDVLEGTLDTILIKYPIISIPTPVPVPVSTPTPVPVSSPLPTPTPAPVQPSPTPTEPLPSPTSSVKNSSVTVQTAAGTSTAIRSTSTYNEIGKAVNGDAVRSSSPAQAIPVLETAETIAIKLASETSLGLEGVKSSALKTTVTLPELLHWRYRFLMSDGISKVKAESLLRTSIKDTEASYTAIKAIDEPSKETYLGAGSSWLKKIYNKLRLIFGGYA